MIQKTTRTFMTVIMALSWRKSYKGLAIQIIFSFLESAMPRCNSKMSVPSGIREKNCKKRKIVVSNLNFLYPYLSKSNYHVWKYYFWLSVLSLPSTDKSYFEIRGTQVNPFLYRIHLQRSLFFAYKSNKALLHYIPKHDCQQDENQTYTNIKAIAQQRIRGRRSKLELDR